MEGNEFGQIANSLRSREVTDFDEYKKSLASKTNFEAFGGQHKLSVPGGKS